MKTSKLEQKRYETVNALVLVISFARLARHARSDLCTISIPLVAKRAGEKPNAPNTDTVTDLHALDLRAYTNSLAGNFVARNDRLQECRHGMA
jgi:hypothetical protein